MTAVRIAVASRPNSAQPAQSISLPDRELAGFGVELAEHVLERLVEAGDALVFEGEADVIHVDAHGTEAAHHLACAFHVGVDGAGQPTVVLERGDGCLGERVDRVGSDQAVDVERVGVGSVLGGGRRPERALHVRTELGEAVPTITGEAFPEQLVESRHRTEPSSCSGGGGVPSPGSTSLSDSCHTGLSVTVSTLNPYSNTSEPPNVAPTVTSAATTIESTRITPDG